MLVTKLLVEGELDAQLLFSVCTGGPVIEAAKASKDALAPRVREERHKEKLNGGLEKVFYLRDRDFDFEPPDHPNRPCEDKYDENQVLGWRWCRHSIENYMLEPTIACAALDSKEDRYSGALKQAGKRIQFYQAGRWAIGTARRALPPNYDLRTQPDGADEFFLPKTEEMSKEAARNWARVQVKEFVDRVRPALSETSIGQSFDQHTRRFEKDVCDSVEATLVWFSGKDLMLALKDWWSSLGVAGPNDFRNRLRDWMREHPEEVLSALPEWQAFLEIMRKSND